MSKILSGGDGTNVDSMEYVERLSKILSGGDGTNVNSMENVEGVNNC